MVMRIREIEDLKRRLHFLRATSEEELRAQREKLALIHAFAGRLTKEFGGYIYGVIVFGSAVEEAEPRDIDVLIIANDVDLPITSEIISSFRLSLAKMIADLRAEDVFHLNVLGLKEFWEGVRHADPVVIDILRKGYAVIDTGFFAPLQKLLKEGRISPTREAIEARMRRAKTMVLAAKQHNLAAVDDLYWAVMDAAQAFLMSRGELPPPPAKIAGALRKYVRKKLLKKEHAELAKKMYELMKEIARAKVLEVSGREVDELKEKVEDFVELMERLLKGGEMK